jgi:hypothetical protein
MTLFPYTTLFRSPARLRYNAEFFCASGHPDIERNLCGGQHRKAFQGICLDLDNTPAHKVKRSQQGIAQTESIRVTRRSYSPNAASTDFLFSHLKCEMAMSTAISPENIIFEIRRIFEEIPWETLNTICNECIPWLERITQHKEECCHTK